MPIPEYNEMAGSPVEDFSTDSFQATRNLMVAWGERHALVDALGYTLYPYLPLTGARARNIACVPAPGAQTTLADGAVAYEASIVTVQYRASPKDPQTEDLVTESLQPNAEHRPLDFEDFRWDAIDGDLINADEAPSLLIPAHDYILTFHKLLTVPIEVITLEGYVNNSPFSTYTLGLTYPTGTLLFAGGSPQRKVTTTAVEAFTMTLRFKYRRTGWDKFWRQGAADPTTAWQSIYHKKSGLHLNYPLANFAALLPAAPSA